MENKRLIHLLNAYPDGRLSAPEKAELEGVLMESAEARRLFWDVASLHGLTREAAKLKWIEHPEAEKAGGRRGWAGWGRGWGRWAAGGGWAGLWPRPLRWAWPWGVAAVAVLVLVHFWLDFGVGQLKVAVLTRAVDVEWEEDSGGTPMAGASLKRRAYSLKRGAVQVRFHNGAAMVFEAPARFRIVSHRQVYCQLGRFRVHVPPEARGFTLSLEGLGVVDLGTEFGLSVPPNGPAEVHVFTGEVEVTRTGPTATTLLLAEGDAVRVEPNRFHRMDASHLGFVSEAALVRRDLPEVRRRHEAWRKESETLARDPSTLLHYSFEQSSPWDKVVANRATNALPESHGMVAESRWTEGRWPGKKALQIRRAGDRVRLRLPQPMRAVTCLVWVRVDGLPNGFVHSLLTGDSEGPGTPRWTISRAGNIRLGLANPSTGPEAAWVVGESPPVVNTNIFGQWTMLASVYDGAKILHYLDGRLVWSGPVKGPELLTFGWVELGNWVARPDHPDFQWAKTKGTSYFTRDFEGRFDEVAVLARVMSAEEIKRYFEAGRPLDQDEPRKN